MSKLLNNLPIEDLNSENDYLGIIDKGQIIKTFLESNKDEFKDIKMFCLYGEWGSGKSTLMKYLQKELKVSFNTFFFEAWEFESDSNLSLSLLEYLVKKSQDSTDEAFGEILEVAAKLFKGFSKSIRISVPGLSIDGSKLVETLEEVPEETFLQLKEKFKIEFRKWEDNNTKSKKKNFNIVFVDDLDRCEPENVLNLLSALKLFFTYGEKTIFFCGIDKKAVNEAVKTKYGKVVKANEYLEKIFDISFTMPEYDDLLKLVNLYFNNVEVSSLKGKLNLNISSFFKVLKITNPRRIKKVLNKFQIFRSIKENNSRIRLPNIYIDNEGNYFETILVLYFIILHEFHPKLFHRVFDMKYKESYLLGVVNKSVKEGSLEGYQRTIEHLATQDLINKKISSIHFSNNQYQEFVFSFLPNNVLQLSRNSYTNDDFLLMKVSEKNIEYRFIEYVLNNENILDYEENDSDLSMNEIKQLITKIL
ncbi:MAG: P-loop NTPase fold protein [Gelidibacter sp.]